MPSFQLTVAVCTRYFNFCKYNHFILVADRLMELVAKELKVCKQVVKHSETSDIPVKGSCNRSSE
jgi:hypothetical protein